VQNKNKTKNKTKNTKYKRKKEKEKEKEKKGRPGQTAVETRTSNQPDKRWRHFHIVTLTRHLLDSDPTVTRRL
jgi:hypothetical protein